MPTHFRDPVLTCDTCTVTVDRPLGTDYRDGWRRLAEQGWIGRANPAEKPIRFAPRTTIWKCGNCSGGAQS